MLWSGCLLIVAAAIAALGYVAGRLAPLTVALAATLFLAALFDPVNAKLRRLRVPAGLAALATLLLLVVVFGGIAAVVWQLTADEFHDLAGQLSSGLHRLRDFVTTHLPVSNRQLDQGTSQVTEGLRRSAPGAVAGARTAAEVGGTVLLTIVLLFFVLKDGRAMWGWLLSRLSERTRPVVQDTGVIAWRTLARYTRGTVAIAAIDGIGIGIALVLLRVPLAFPLALLTFLGGFIPIIGAAVASAVAVLVALATRGPAIALLTVLAVIVVQMTEGNVLQPLIMKRQVLLHPAAVLIAVAAGSLFGGIPGAFIAVPVTAITYRVIETVAAHRRAAGGPP